MNKFMKTKMHITGIMLFGLCLAIVLMSCGKHQEGTSEADEVRIGVLLPQTGDWAWIGPAINGARFAANEINRAGGIPTEDGKFYKIRIYSEDSGTESRMAISGAGKLYNMNDVIAIIGPASATIRSVIPLTTEAGAVLISPTAGTTALDNRGGGINDEWVFRSVGSDIIMGSGMVHYAKDNLGAKRAACFFADDEGARSIYGVVQDAAAVAGIEIVKSIMFPAGQTSYRSELTGLAESRPDVIFFESSPETAGIFFKQWYELGYEGKWVGTDFVNEKLINATWPASKGVYGVNPGPLPGPRYENWLKNYEDFKGNKGLDPFAINAYDAMNILALAMARSGAVTSDGIKESIKEVAGPPGEQVTDFVQGLALIREGKDIDYDGMAGPQDFNHYGDPVTYLKVEQIEDARLTRVATFTDKTIESLVIDVMEIRRERAEK